MRYSFYYPSENKVFVAQNAKFLENGLIAQEASESLEDLEIIQEEDTHPSIDTILNHKEDDQEIDEPQSDINLIRRSQGHTGPRIKCVLYINAKNMIRGSREPLTIKPHCDIRSIRILIAIAAFYDYEIWQMDVKTAFLNGYLNEEKFGFSQNRNELCVYVKASRSYDTFLILYVDDILIMGNNIPMLQDVKSYLGRCFAMKDLGEDAYILGIKIYRDRSKQLIGLCHSAYIEKILKRFYMENSKHETIPIQEKLKLSKSQGASTPAEIQRMQNIPYALVLGSIMYAVRCTRPDVVLCCSTIEEPINMYCDNTRAIEIAKDHGVTKGARHFRRKVHYLRETIEMGDVKIEKVDTYDNLADPFMMALAFPKHSKLTKKIGMIPASSLMFNMRRPTLTMEEYIRFEEEKAQKRRKVFNWETAKYGKIWYDENIYDLRSVDVE
ncbi:retrotransposon protein, putative, ty1-copia subclass [Tanacetum coccineum]